tara:strand:+ start:731 stop:2605 length:1875 start_codon:yes stop_codon:yes gene_type:complete
MIDAIYTSISEYLGETENNLVKNKKLITIANKLNSLYSNDKIKIPQLVVTGCQSSAKSSTLCGLMSMNILPTGKNMVTRTPTKLELSYTDNNKIIIDIGHYKNYEFISNKKYEYNEITIIEEEIIQEHIEQFTLKYAGDMKNISFKEIVIRISSNSVPNLTLIDLPGLVMVACTDQGQPEDIKKQIKDLIKHYITQDNTIIMGVFPARSDLEVDSALELIKEYDKSGDRTIGILTKIDLMNENSDIVDYLENNISNDLKLKYGYYGVKNKIDKNISYKEHYNHEANYFNNHKIYKNVNKSRLGTLNLSIDLSNILINEIKKKIPEIQTTISEKLININQQLEDLGENIVIDNNNKNFILNLYISDFVEFYKDTLNNHSKIINNGRHIKNIFIDYRNNLHNIDCLKNISNQKIQNIINDCEGNHMYYQNSIIEILEKCLIDNELNIIDLLKNPTLKCIENIIALLSNIINNVLNIDKFNKYPELKNYVLHKSQELIEIYKKDILKYIYFFIDTEKSYIWTESNDFKLKYKNINLLDDNFLNDIKILIQSYFTTLIVSFENLIPKVIMSEIIKKIQKNLFHSLMSNIKEDDILKLLKESDIIHNKRTDLLNQKKFNQEIHILLNDL